MNKLKTFTIITKFRNATQLILNRLFFPKSGPTFYQYENLRFLVDHDTGDQDGPRACVFPGLYDPFLKAANFKGEVSFIDLGANAGGFVLSMLKAGIQIHKGLAVELNPITWSRLVYNVYANVPLANEKIKLLNGAVAGDNGILNIRLGGGGVGDSIVGTQEGQLYHLEKFALANLVTEFPSAHVDVLKIDIEGSEYDLLTTPPDCLAKVVWVIIEIHAIEGRSEQEVFEWIQAGGFERIQPKETPIENNVYLFRNGKF